MAVTKTIASFAITDTGDINVADTDGNTITFSPDMEAIAAELHQAEGDHAASHIRFIAEAAYARILNEMTLAGTYTPESLLSRLAQELTRRNITVDFATQNGQISTLS